MQSRHIQAQEPSWTSPVGLGELGWPRLLQQCSKPSVWGLTWLWSLWAPGPWAVLCQDLGPALGSFLITAVSPSLDHPLVHSATSDLAVMLFSSGFLPVCALTAASALQVHLCEADGLLEFLGVSSSEFTHQPVLVAVKMLRSDVNKTAR